MAWLPDDFFIGYPDPPETRPQRPLGQGDVFLEVPVAGRTAIKDGQPGLKAKKETVIVVASSCGMRKGAAGALNDTIHVAPVKKLASLAPGWAEPWPQEQWLHVLPLRGLVLAPGGEAAAADLSRIGLCGTDTLDTNKRIGCVSLKGMQALKARLSGYFIRVPAPDGIVSVGAHEEWNELDLWERWTRRTGSDTGFQEWFSEENPNYPGKRRRDTIYDDLVGIRQQLDEAT